MLGLRQVLSNLTFANQLTFLRLAAIPFLALALLNNRPGLALGIFVAAAVTDVLDGLIARLLKQRTALGALLDPAADKLLITCLFVILCLPDNIRIAPEFALVNRVPVWLVVLSISRDLFISLTALILYLSSGVRQFPPTLLGKLTTFSEVALVTLVLIENARGVESALAVPLAVWTTLAMIIASGLHYIYRTAVLIRETEEPAAAGGTPIE